VNAGTNSSANTSQAPSVFSQDPVYVGRVPTSKATESACFICGSRAERTRIPGEAILQVFMEKQVWVKSTNRVCRNHLNGNIFSVDSMQLIQAHGVGFRMKPDDIGDLLLHLINDKKSSLRIDFNSNDLSEDEYKLLTGISKNNFEDLYGILSGKMRSSHNRHPRNALGMLLMTLRLDLTQRFLAFLFKTQQQVVSESIKAVSKILEDEFVPVNLGFSHMSREEAIRKHSRKFFNQLFEKPEDTLFLTADGTYLFIDKPGDFEEQRKTFSLHKHRNLLKPMMIILPSGYLIDAPGMFYADSNNNDAHIMKYIFKNTELGTFVEEGDCLIYDRGFRDIVEENRRAGLEVYMPSLLPNGRKQFTAVEGNHSRRVTMVRWLVESTNGRLKNVFSFFKGTIVGSHKGKIKPFFKIACALLNKYFDPLFNDAEKHERFAEVVLARLDMPNLLQSRAEELRLIRMTGKWQRASEETVGNFPRLTWAELEEFTLGSYQLFIADKYNKQHLKHDSQYTIYVHEDIPDSMVRGKIQSRFSKSKTHSCWLEYIPGQNGCAAIKGWYCSCKTGARIVGACSHVVSVRYINTLKSNASK